MAIPTVAEQLIGTRHIIGPDSPIMGGILLSRCAVVVDFVENPEPYEALFERLDASLGVDGHADTLRAAVVLNRVIQKGLHFNDKKMGQVLREEADSRKVDRLGLQDEVGFSEFIEAGGVNCELQTLAAATLVTLLKDRRQLDWRVSVEPTSAPEEHKWMRLTSGEDRVISDNCNEIVRRLEDTQSRFGYGYYRASEVPFTGRLLSAFGMVQKASSQA